MRLNSSHPHWWWCSMMWTQLAPLHVIETNRLTVTKQKVLNLSCKNRLKQGILRYSSLQSKRSFLQCESNRASTQEQFKNWLERCDWDHTLPVLQTSKPLGGCCDCWIDRWAGWQTTTAKTHIWLCFYVALFTCAQNTWKPTEIFKTSCSCEQNKHNFSLQPHFPAR